MEEQETQNVNQEAQAPEGQVQEGSQETPQQDPVAKLKELEQKLNEANTQRATLEARYNELSNVQQSYAQPAQAAPSLDDRLDKVVNGFLDDPQAAKAELANIIQETKDDASYTTTALVQGMMAMNNIKATKPHLAPFENVLNQKAQELMYNNSQLSYEQALAKSADEFDGLIQKANSTRNQGQGTEGQADPQQVNVAGPGGNMRQAPPVAPVKQQQTLSLSDELANRNRAMSNKFSVKAR